MSDFAIYVENLGKEYRIGGAQEAYKTLRESLSGLARRKKRRSNEKFWALKDVSFEVKRGEVVGVIGRNGAGKSTLLKVLSRITEPTQGSVRIRGRVGSLLEVGTGFHPELSGRENIFLNGAILGMSRSVIEKRFDEIVDFAEVEKFIDTPVKRYSSGMYLRLAFAVAAHLEPDILVIDEVLAVGDSTFQKKCLQKMEQVGNNGQTVLFVSHNMSAMQALCERAIVLDKGSMIGDLPATQAAKLYLQESSNQNSFERVPRVDGKTTIVGGRLHQFNEEAEPWVEVVFDVAIEESRHLAVDVRLKDSWGVPVGMACLGSLNPSDMVKFQPPLTRVQFRFSSALLALGSYNLSIDITIPGAEFVDRAENCLSFDLNRPPKLGAIYALPQEWRHGCIELLIHDLCVETSPKFTLQGRDQGTEIDC